MLTIADKGGRGGLADIICEQPLMQYIFQQTGWPKHGSTRYKLNEAIVLIEILAAEMLVWLVQ